MPARKISKKTVHEIFKRLHDQTPIPIGELNYVNTFTLLVAVVLSAQATDVGVNKATKDLFENAPTPEKMKALGLDGIKSHIKTIGLYNSKAKNVLKLCEILIDQHNSIVPNNRDKLIELPGVGRKTANVVMNIAFGEPTIAVDTHVYRVSHRLGLSKGKTPDYVEVDLEKIIPSEFLLHAHNWLILHGRYTCKARTPLCAGCVVNDLCSSKDKIVVSK